MKTDEKRTALEAEAMMCIGGEAELIRRLLTKIGDKWTIFVVLSLDLLVTRVIRTEGTAF